MALDALLILDGITSESEDKAYPGSIKLSDFHWGVTNESNARQGTGSAKSAAEFDHMTVTKMVDKASATLLQFCSTGMHFNTGKLVFRRQGGAKKVEYLVIELKKVFITGVHNEGSPDGEELQERITLYFGEFKYVYTPQNDDGSAGVSSDFAWNLPQGAEA